MISLISLDKESMMIEIEKKNDEGVVFFYVDGVWAKVRLWGADSAIINI